MMGTQATKQQKKRVPQPMRFPDIERKPQPDWLITAVNEYGEREIFLRVQTTGMYPRRFGPFQTEHDAWQFLNGVCREVWDAFQNAPSGVDGALITIEDAVTLQSSPGPNGHTQPSKPGSTTFENWRDLIFLVKEPNRKGVLMWWVRVVVGDLDPVRSGPYATEKEARAAFEEIVGGFGYRIYDCMPTSNVTFER